MKLLAMLAVAGFAANVAARPASSGSDLGPDFSDAAGADGRGTTNAFYTVDLEDAESWGHLGNDDNMILTFDVTPGYRGDTVTGIAWDLTIETVGESWLSDVTFGFNDSTGDAPGGFDFTPGADPGGSNDMPGVRRFASDGFADLTFNGLPNLRLQHDGLLVIEIYEVFDDDLGSVDAFISGTLTIGLLGLPAPSGAVVFFGLGGAVATRRRR